MFSKTVRILALGLSVGSLGLVLQACSDPSSESDEVKVGVEDDLAPTSCSPSGYCDPKYNATFSQCQPLTGASNASNLPANTRMAKAESYAYDASGALYFNVDCGRIENQEDNKTYRCQAYAKEVGWAYRKEQVYDPLTGQYKGVTAVYVQAGSSVSTELGSAANDFVVGAKVFRTKLGYGVNCIEPKTLDAVGTSAGYELAGACAVEQSLSASNAVWGSYLVNFATKEVGTTSNPHPDGTPLGWTNGVNFYYKGQGAALNDINGSERDEYGNYLPGAERCHVVWSNGYEVPAAKRPSTGGYPAKVNVNSPILWRNVDSRVGIAN